MEYVTYFKYLGMTIDTTLAFNKRFEDNSKVAKA